jgi:hypothetical protein
MYSIRFKDDLVFAVRICQSLTLLSYGEEIDLTQSC